MAITLATVTLPDDLIWIDELNFEPVAQAQTRTVGGQLIVEETALIAGRLITLAGGPNHGWIDRATLLALRALADAPNSVRLLTLHDASTFDVMFRRPAIEAEPVLAYREPIAGDFYAVKVNLFEV